VTPAERKRLDAYRARVRLAHERAVRAVVLEACRDEGTGSPARYRATRELVAAAAAGEQVTEGELCRRAACSRRTMRRAKRSLVRSQLVNVHAPAPIRDRAGQCVGRDVRGSRLLLALESRAAKALAAAAGLRPPMRPRKASNTKSGLRGAPHQHLPGFPDGKPPPRLGAVRQE
jgi:hypothetical protein